MLSHTTLIGPNESAPSSHDSHESAWKEACVISQSHVTHGLLSIFLPLVAMISHLLNHTAPSDEGDNSHAA